MYSWHRLVIFITFFISAAPAMTADQRYGYGTVPTEIEIRAWDIDVRADGAGLPDGKGSSVQGEALYLQLCSACHGEFGEGIGRFPALIGGEDSLDKERPKKTVGSYWPYATTLWDYINRSMPFGNAQSLEPDQVYAIVAYILNMNDLISADTVLDRKSLPAIRMPNRDGFLSPDPRPDVHSKACMKNCRDNIEITSHTRNKP